MAFSQKCKSFVQMSPFAALSLWYFFSWKRRELISKKKKDSTWFSNVKIYTNFDIYREFPPQCHYCHTSKVQNFRLNGIVSILMGLVEISEYFRLFHSIHEQKKKGWNFWKSFYCFHPCSMHFLLFATWSKKKIALFDAKKIFCGALSNIQVNFIYKILWNRECK